MKYALGLFLFMASTTLFADSVLILRGRVPASFHVELDQQNKTPYKESKRHRSHWKVVSNQDKAHGGPRLDVKVKQGTYLVSLTHP